MQSYLKDENIVVTHGDGFKLKAFDTDYKAGLAKNEGKELFEQVRESLAELQDKLYAQSKHSVLLVFQAMDAAGKDGTIKSVMTGVNPQGCHVVSFKKPTQMELEHDFLWRCYKELPAQGHIGIFNRSYYEEVLVTRVHPEFILPQNIKNIDTLKSVDDDFWKRRYESILNFERHLTESGTVILKFFLNVSKEEQKKRFLERIAEPEKNWKFSYADLGERKHWDKYQSAYEAAIANTATKHAPWHIIPADSNWMRNLLVCSIVHDTLRNLDVDYPKIDEGTRQLLQKGQQELLSE